MLYTLTCRRCQLVSLLFTQCLYQHNIINSTNFNFPSLLLHILSVSDPSLQLLFMTSVFSMYIIIQQHSMRKLANPLFLTQNPSVCQKSHHNWLVSNNQTHHDLPASRRRQVSIQTLLMVLYPRTGTAPTYHYFRFKDQRSNSSL